MYLDYCFSYKYLETIKLYFYHGIEVLYVRFFNCGYLDLNVCYYGRQTVNIILNSNSQNNLISPYKIRLTFLQMLLFLIMNIYICILTQATVHSSYCQLGLGDISHVICMRISSVKPAPWLAVNLHHLFSNGVAFNTQSRWSLTSDAISLSLSQMNRLRYECDIASLVSDISPSPTVKYAFLFNRLHCE